MQKVQIAVLVASVLAVSGCESASLLKDVKERTTWKQGRRDQGYLGVVVSSTPGPDMTGLRIVRVVKCSPASKVGLHEGDFIHEVYGDPFDTPPSGTIAIEGEDARPAPREPEAPSVPPGRRIDRREDLEAALLKAGPRAKVTLVVSRANEVMTIPVELDDPPSCWNEQTRVALANAEENKATLSLPLLVDYERQRIDAQVYRDYFGVAVKEPVRRYLNVDVLPVLFLSLFRYESVPAAGAWRLKVLCWPFVFTSYGEKNASADGIAEPGQQDLVEL